MEQPSWRSTWDDYTETYMYEESHWRQPRDTPKEYRKQVISKEEKEVLKDSVRQLMESFREGVEQMQNTLIKHENQVQRRKKMKKNMQSKENC